MCKLLAKIPWTVPSWTAETEQKHDVYQKHFSLKTTGSVADKPNDVLFTALKRFDAGAENKAEVVLNTKLFVPPL